MEELKLQMPIKPNRQNGIILITQEFGANDVPYYSQWGLKGHNGIDFSTIHCQNGEAPILSAMKGYVVSDKTIQSDSKGRFVTTLSEPVLVNGKEAKVECCYFHLKEARVSVTDPLVSDWFWLRNTKSIKPGVLIGTSDNTGIYTTGSHLHFHIRIYWLRENGYYTPDYTNGYDGCIDPMPFLKDGNVYQVGTGIEGRKFFYNGQQIDRSKVNSLIPKQYQ